MEWNVLIENNGRIEVYNIFRNYYMYEWWKKWCKGEVELDSIERELKYAFWCKAEYELMVCGLFRGEKKVDIYQQVMMNVEDLKRKCVEVRARCLGACSQGGDKVSDTETKSPMYYIVGASGSGKSTLAKRLGKEVQSYTTRPKRYEGEEGHIFVDKYDGKGVAWSRFNGYDYWCTEEQLKECDVYVVDWAGIDMLRGKGMIGEGDVVIYMDVSEEERRRRMRLRGDSDEMIEERIKHDRIVFPEERKYEADVVVEEGEEYEL